MRILLVDNDPNTKNTFASNLLLRGHKVQTAFDGTDAFYKYITYLGTFDLVITDYNLPIKDGLWLVEKIRGMAEQKDLKKDVKIIVRADPETTDGKALSAMISAGAEKQAYWKISDDQLVEMEGL